MKPDHFRDIIATNALYRPGPLEGGLVDDYIEVKHGRKQAYYPHPVMREVLDETHGVMVFQEQVMRILNLLGGINLADAYSCIKAISKKKLEMIAKFREAFIEGARDKGLEKKKAEELFSQIEKFAGYGFNKSHSTAYALIAYQTAYLKAHYPVEFMAALLSGDIPGRNFKSKDPLVEHLEDCERMEVTVVPPDVNRSDVDFAVSGSEILFGLSAIKGCGSGAAEAISAARRLDGPFTSLFDFCERVDPQACGRAAIETLIKAGAFDTLGAKRAQLMAAIDRAMQSGAAVLADRKSGQRGLFDGGDDDTATTANQSLPNLPEFAEKEKLAMEKEVLGFYLTSHPLAQHEGTLRTYCSHTSTQLGGLEHRSEVMVGGMLAAIKFSHTKNPRPGSTHTKYAMWDLEDLDGIVRCIMWPEQFAEFGELVKSDAILGIRAAIDRRPGAEEINLIVNELIPLEELSARFSNAVLIRVREDVHGIDILTPLREIVRGYPGNKPLKLRLDLADGGNVTLDCAKSAVTIDPELRRRVEELLGPGSFRVTGSAPKPSPPPRQGAQMGGQRWRAAKSRRSERFRMSQTNEALLDPYLDRLDRWISETRDLAARTTDAETLKCAEEELRRWMDERTRYARAIQWNRNLNRITAVLIRVLSFGVGLLFFAALLLNHDTVAFLVAIAIGIVTVIVSGVMYLVATTTRDALAHGQDVWRFSLRSLLVVTTILAIVLGLLAFLVRI